MKKRPIRWNRAYNFITYFLDKMFVIIFMGRHVIELKTRYISTEDNGIYYNLWYVYDFNNMRVYSYIVNSHQKDDALYIAVDGKQYKKLVAVNSELMIRSNVLYYAGDDADKEYKKYVNAKMTDIILED